MTLTADGTRAPITADDLIAFEDEVAGAFEAKKIRAPIHLSGGNEHRLIEIFQDVGRQDWVFCSYRNHYHALLHGVPRERVMAEILAGKSMNMSFPEYRFFSSAIVAGCLPIATGAALAVKRGGGRNHVWCFVGDMAATTGAYHEATRYARGQQLPITFVIEDNGLACDSPTEECWGPQGYGHREIRYKFQRKWPHVGIPKYVNF